MSKHAPKFHSHLGRSFLIVAQFPYTEAGTKKANEYMERHPKAGLLTDADGVLIISHNDDKGDGAGASTLSPNAKRAAAKYGLGVCLQAYEYTKDGDGARTIAYDFDMTTRQADAAIEAGRQLAGMNPVDSE